MRHIDLDFRKTANWKRLFYENVAMSEVVDVEGREGPCCKWIHPMLFHERMNGVIVRFLLMEMLSDRSFFFYSLLMVIWAGESEVRWKQSQRNFIKDLSKRYGCINAVKSFLVFCVFMILDVLIFCD